MDFSDPPALAAFRAEARAWLEENVARSDDDPGPLAIFSEESEDPAYLVRARHWQARLADAGWAGVTWPEEHGGRGLTALHEVVWQQEASAYDLPTGVFSIGIGMGGPTVMSWGTEEQKRRWLRPLLRGEEIWCQLFSEPEAGSDVAAARTRAVRDGEEWVVHGQKVWTSGAHYSKWGMLLARTDPAQPKHAGLSYFVIDMDQPGVVVRPLRQMTGGANFNEVFFDGARVPHAHLLGGEGQGWMVALTTLMNERLSIGRTLIGAGRAFAGLRALFSIVQARTGRSPLEHPVWRHQTVDLYIHAQVLRYMTQRLITKFARGEMPTAEGSAAKLGLSALLARFGNLVVDSQGAAGILAGTDAFDRGEWQTTFLSYPGLRIAGGTDEVLKNVIGERVLGLPGEPRSDKDLPFRQLAASPRHPGSAAGR